MKSISPMMTLIDAYAAATGLPDKTLSFRVFKDSKKISALRDGGDITTTRLDDAVAWFSDHWPDDVEWPADIVRPQHRRPEQHPSRRARASSQPNEPTM